MTEIEKKAIELFGTTKDCYEAGYMLKDGTLLDFSEKIFGGIPGHRSLDHREVSELFEDLSGTNAMKEFVRLTGAIRLGFSLYNNHATVDITTEENITSIQERLLCKYCAKADKVFIDYYNNYDSETPYREYSLDMPRVGDIKKVLNEIRSGE